MGARIAVDGPVDPRTGIGVLQNHLYPELRKLGYELVERPTRDMGATRWRRVLGLVRGLRPVPKGTIAYISLVPPFPISSRPPAVAFIHDLRWQRTRTGLDRAYRRWDLRRTVSEADRLVCISQRTLEDLQAFMGTSLGKASVVPLGPGLVDRAPERPKQEGLLLLVGGARHKRNELAALALAQARPAWLKGVIGVGLSSVARSTLEASFGAEFCDWRSGISDDSMRDIYARAEVFLLLSVEEGFGLPYIEALASGCQVICIDQPLTRDLLGNASVKIFDGDAESIAEQLKSPVWVDSPTRRTQAALYSWEKSAGLISQLLEQIRDDGGHG